ncbi:hypothetical protein RRG08_063937 [Elysia crispata]|uniref:Uncharacterized protein n=1 Tax=Elysia crispata TaxID=231223 RepID=A0AAE0YER4_9GAST|nr:hypothetical protein RRG08_063937 [Elysia crispata]
MSSAGSNSADYSIFLELSLRHIRLVNTRTRLRCPVTVAGTHHRRPRSSWARLARQQKSCRVPSGSVSSSPDERQSHSSGEAPDASHTEKDKQSAGWQMLFEKKFSRKQQTVENSNSCRNYKLNNMEVTGIEPTNSAWIYQKCYRGRPSVENERCHNTCTSHSGDAPQGDSTPRGLTKDSSFMRCYGPGAGNQLYWWGGSGPARWDTGNIGRGVTSAVTGLERPGAGNHLYWWGGSGPARWDTGNIGRGVTSAVTGLERPGAGNQLYWWGGSGPARWDTGNIGRGVTSGVTGLERATSSTGGADLVRLVGILETLGVASHPLLRAWSGQPSLLVGRIWSGSLGYWKHWAWRHIRCYGPGAGNHLYWWGGSGPARWDTGNIGRGVTSAVTGLERATISTGGADLVRLVGILETLGVASHPVQTQTCRLGPQRLVQPLLQAPTSSI